MIDHILEHLDVADHYAANAARLVALKYRSRQSRDPIRRCREAADRERAQAANHAKSFDIDPLVVAEELASWRRLRHYRLDRLEALTVTELRWLHTVVRHGRSGSLNVRRANELLCLTGAFLDHDREGFLSLSRREAVFLRRPVVTPAFPMALAETVLMAAPTSMKTPATVVARISNVVPPAARQLTT